MKPKNRAVELALPLEVLRFGEPPCNDLAIDANSDSEAVAVWLQAKGGRSPNTFDSYRREALRLLMWLSEQQMSLSDMKVNHVHQFYAHLANPPTHWVRPRKTKHDEALLPTQVLMGALSTKSIDYTRTILSQMFAYMQDAGFLTRNAFRLSVKPPTTIQTTPTRYLDLESWRWLWSWIEKLPRSRAIEVAHADRCRWLFALLYHTGIRRDEAAFGRMSDFTRRDRSWYLRVIGKGNKERFLTVNSTLFRELMTYRRSLKLPDYPTPDETFPLVASVNAMRHGKLLTPRVIGLIVSNVAQQASHSCGDKHLSAQIGRMTTHWMRHTNATHRLLAGASLETTQDELGHADPRTTRIYAKVADKKRQDDSEKLAELNEKWQVNANAIETNNEK